MVEEERIALHEDDNKYDNTYIGKYKTQQGKVYKLLLITQNKKQYICVSEIGVDLSGRYYL